MIQHPSPRCLFDSGLKPLALFLGLAVSCAVFPALAQDDASQSTDGQPNKLDQSSIPPLIALDQVTVVASKIPKMIRDVTGTVTVQDRESMEFQQVNDIEDLVRYDPAISVPRDATRFGNAGFTIRGIGGNRVTVEVDGVPISDGFRTGSFSNAGRDWVAPELLRQVEILRGPSSALYGSDAIGGVVLFRTRDPWDYLQADQPYYLGTTLGYFSADQRAYGTATYATESGDSSFLASGSYASGHELEIKEGPAGIPANPQDVERYDVLAKFVHAGSNVTTRVIADYDNESVQTDVQTGLGERDLSDFVGFPLIVNTTLLLGDDEQERTRLSAEFATQDDLWGASGLWRVYYLNNRTVQDTVEERTSTAFGMSTPTRRERRFTLDRDIYGGEVVWNRQLEGDNWSQDLVFGADIEVGETSELRDGRETNLITGDVTNVVASEDFPVRDFPITDTLQLAVFAQDDIVSQDGLWSLIPALRIEYYKIDPETDPIFAEDNPDTEPAKVSDTSVSPKFGLVRDLSDTSQVFAQYAHGYRAPPLEDVNFGIALTSLNIIALPNPDLKPETSDGIEFGYRYGSSAGSLNLSAYYTEYDDFIESRVNQGFDPVAGALIFQSVNRSSAKIYGIEASGALDLEQFSAGLERWMLRGGLAWTRGDDDERNQPLSSVDPPQLVMGLRHDAADGRWGVELIGTFVERQDRVDTSGDPLFQAPGYGLLDLIGDYRFTPKVRLNWGLFNLTDKRYWKWANVRGRPADDPQLAVLSEAGLNARVSLHIDW